MSAKLPVDWEAIERDVANVFDGIFAGPESGVVAEILMEIGLGVFADLYGWPAILHYELEYPVPRGRIDILLIHVDGSATVIECKAGRKASDILPAIGQVMNYGVQIGYSRLFSKIRLAIASRALAADLAGIKPVMKACGIEPVFTGMHRQTAAGLVDEMRKRDWRGP